MSKHKVKFSHPRQRSVLTDMLPFEVPPTFSNRGYYNFLRRYNVDISHREVSWINHDDSLDLAMSFIFGAGSNASINAVSKSEWGKVKSLRSIKVNQCEFNTIPFNFSVAHKSHGRVLSVIHPRNQIEMACFYADNSSLITYYTSISDFSIRKPVSIAKYTYFEDKLHEQTLEETNGVEVEGKEYEQLGSYFVYKKYRNIHKFFESYKYHRCEKKYDSMVQIDINKCFDSIYTHSLPWAVLGKEQIKGNLEESKTTFGGKFDTLMQKANYKETNGIVIGPEFSRIFAEIILQSVDIDLALFLLEKFQLKHKVDYEIFRYVDDYFVFYNKPATQQQVIDALENCLKKMKLSINVAKIKPYEKPIITEITIAKERISIILSESITYEIKEADEDDPSKTPKKHFHCSINANSLIVKFKAAIKESKVEYGDLLNYTLAIIENKLYDICGIYLKSDVSNKDKSKLINSFIALLEFAFFSYSASPKVNHTIRISRLISSMVKFINDHELTYDHKHLIFKYIHDNILYILTKNTMDITREIESLYLLTVLSQIGKEYWLPETTLAKHFLIEFDSANDCYKRKTLLSHFSITVLLSYVKNKKRYAKIKSFIEKHCLQKLQYEKFNCHIGSEAFMLFLDLIVCPYIETETKEGLGSIFDFDIVQLGILQDSNDYWFTAWGNKFDLAKELDMKRSREVY